MMRTATALSMRERESRAHGPKPQPGLRERRRSPATSSTAGTNQRRHTHRPAARIRARAALRLAHRAGRFCASNGLAPDPFSAFAPRSVPVPFIVAPANALVFRLLDDRQRLARSASIRRRRSALPTTAPVGSGSSPRAGRAARSPGRMRFATVSDPARWPSRMMRAAAPVLGVEPPPDLAAAVVARRARPLEDLAEQHQHRDDDRRYRSKGLDRAMRGKPAGTAAARGSRRR